MLEVAAFKFKSQVSFGFDNICTRKVIVEIRWDLKNTQTVPFWQRHSVVRVHVSLF